MARKTNFDIVNYVHLSYAGALADNQLKGGGKSSTIRNKMNTTYKTLEQNFKANVGVSSKEYIEASKKYGDVLQAIAQMFRCQTIEEMRTFISEEKISQLNLGEIATQNLLAAAKTTGYAELLGQIYSQKGDKTLENKIEEIANSFSGINLYEEILNYLSSKGRGGLSLNKKKQALSLALLDKAMENANIVKSNSKNDTLFSSTFKWQDNSFDTVNKNLENFKDSMKKGIPPKIGELEKIIKNSRDLLNTNIKGASVGEYSSGIIANKLLIPIINGLTETIDVEIQHTGTKSKIKNEISIPIAQLTKKNTTINLKDPVNAVAKGIHTFVARDKKADITISYNNANGENKNIKISTKRYKTSAYAVNLSERISIGQALAFSINGENSVKNFTGKGKTGAQFYNALNFYLLKSSYNVLKDGKIAKVVKENGGDFSINSLDATFGSVLSKFLLEVLAGVLEPEVTAFMDINGMIIPTPIYYKFMMDKFLSENIKNNVSSYIGFNAQSYINKVESKILDVKITGAEKTYSNKPNAKWKTGYAYDVAALKRNLVVKESLLNHSISIRGDFLSLADYRSQFLGL